MSVNDLKAIRTAIWEARSDWQDIGIELGLKVADLDAIEKNNHGNVEKCFSKMLTLWLRRANPPPTWSAMIEALKEPAVGFEDLAEQVESKFMCQSSKASDTTDSGSAVGSTGEYCSYVYSNRNHM